jgi:hypothetical protein
MGNLALHSRYMEASVAYLRDQIERRPRLLQLGMEVSATSETETINHADRFINKSPIFVLTDRIRPCARRSNSTCAKICQRNAGAAEIPQNVP